MKKTFNLGNVKFENRKIKADKVLVDVELKDNNELSICGEIVGTHGDTWRCGGQCCEEIDRVSAQFTKENQSLWKTIYRLWHLYHLNGMHAGTPEQEQALKDAGMTAWANNYTECCDYLESIGLLKTMHNGKEYKFGTAWLFHPIPQEDLTLIHNLLAWKGNEKFLFYL